MIYNHWKDIATLILLAALIVSVQRCNSERSKRINMQSELSRQETVTKIETQRREIAEREKTYPVIDKRLGEIDKEKGKIKKGVTDDVKKVDVNRLADMFRVRGYMCGVQQ